MTDITFSHRSTPSDGFRLTRTWIVFFILMSGMAFAPDTSYSDAGNKAAQLGSFISSMINGTAKFPTRFGVNRQPVIKNSDVSLSFRKDYLNKVIAAYLKNPIALDKAQKNPKSFITVHRIVTSLDPKRNILIVKGDGGVLTLGTSLSGLRGRLVLKRAEFEISPVFTKDKNGRFFLELVPRCVYLDIDQTAPFIDISIAHALQELYFNRKPINPVNVSELLNSDIKGGKKPLIINRIAQAACVVSNSGIEIRTAWAVE